MWLGRKVKLRGRSPTPDFRIIFGTLPYGDAFIRQVGKARQNLLGAVLQVGRDFLAVLNLFPEFFGFSNQSAGILAALLQLGNFLRRTVTPGLNRLGIRNSLPPLLINLVKIF